MTSISNQKIWKITLVVLGFLYLVFELAFNSRIVDGSSGTVDSIQLEAMELQGRILSGIGISLLLFRFANPNVLSKFFKQIFLIGSIGFSLMFFGQDILVTYLVENSTTEQRVDSQHIALLKKGIFTNNIQINDLVLEVDELDSPETKTMTSIMGLMIFGSDDFIPNVKKQASTLVDKISEKDALDTFPDSYGSYQEYQKKVIANWAGLQEGIAEYNRALFDANQDARKQVDDIYLEASKEFVDKKQNIDKPTLIRKALEIKRALKDYFYAKNNPASVCNMRRGRDVCIQNAPIIIEKTYRDLVITNLGHYVAPDYWCHDPKETQETVVIRGKRKSQSIIIQDCNSMDRQFIEDKLIAQITGDDNRTDISNSNIIAKQIRAKLKAKGISLSNGWRMKDRDVIHDAIYNIAKKEIELAYRTKTKEISGNYLDPKINQEEYLSSDSVQNPIRLELDLPSYINVSLDLSSEDFFKQLHKPKYVEFYQEQKVELLKGGLTLADGQVNEIKGKNYYRSVIVPPLAMSFSLFFGLLNLAAFLGVIAAIMLKNDAKGKATGYIIVITVFFLYPYAFPSKTVKSETFEYFQDQLDKKYIGTVSYMASWVIDSQPIIYPIGHFLAKHAGQEEIENLLKSFVEGDIDPELSIAQKAKKEGKGWFDNLAKANDKYFEDGKNDLDSPVESEKEFSFSVKGHQLVRQNSSNNGHMPFSLSLLKYSMENSKGAMINVMPIGDPKFGKWAVYNDVKLRDGVDMCVFTAGSKKATSAREMNPQTWKNSYHGPCVKQGGDITRMPSFDSYLDAVKEYSSKDSHLIFNLLSPASTEVYCIRYKAVIKRILNSVNGKNITISTPSTNVMACLDQLPDYVDVAVDMHYYLNHSENKIKIVRKRGLIERLFKGNFKQKEELMFDENNISNSKNGRLSAKQNSILNKSTAHMDEQFGPERIELLASNKVIDVIIVDPDLINKSMARLLRNKNVGVYTSSHSIVTKEIK